MRSIATDALADVVAADALRAYGAIAFTTTRVAGRSAGPYASMNLALHVGDDADAVRANRRALRERHALPAEPRWLRQVHGTTVATPGCDVEPEADAAWTAARHDVLAVLTADCLPIVIVAGEGRELAVVHAGWKGLADGVIDAALATFRTRGGTAAWLGPAIGPRAYEVGDDVRARFASGGLADGAFSPAARGKWHCDLYAIARTVLSRAGVAVVGGGDRCTFLEADRFYSYRRDGVTGRMATVARLAAEAGR